MANERAMKKVRNDLDAAMKKGLRGTPTFFVNNQKYTGSVPEAKLKQLLGTKEN